MGLMNIAVYCPNCAILMNIHKGKLGDDTLQFKCPKCGDIEEKTSIQTPTIQVETSTCGIHLCLDCVNNKMCYTYDRYMRRGLFIGKCNFYVKRAIGND